MNVKKQIGNPKTGLKEKGQKNLSELLSTLDRKINERNHVIVLNGVEELVSSPPLRSVARAYIWGCLQNYLKAKEELEQVNSDLFRQEDQGYFEVLKQQILSDWKTQKEEIREIKEQNLKSLSRTQPGLALKYARQQYPTDYTWASIKGNISMIQTKGEDYKLIREDFTRKDREMIDQYLSNEKSLYFGELKCGYLLKKAVQLHPEFEDGRKTPVYVMEPSSQIFLIHLLVSDLSIYEQLGNIRFFPGEEGPEKLRKFFDQNPWRSVPEVGIYTEESLSLEEVQNETLESIRFRGQKHQHQVESYYKELCSLKNGPGWNSGDDAPRVLLPTTRFSTRHMNRTKEIQTAFEKLGWETKVLKEPSSLDRWNQRVLYRSLNNVRPDLLFQVNSIIGEQVVPEGLPMISWINSDYEGDGNEFSPETSDQDHKTFAFQYAADPAMKRGLEQNDVRVEGTLSMERDPDLVPTVHKEGTSSDKYSGAVSFILDLEHSDCTYKHRVKKILEDVQSHLKESLSGESV